MLSIIIFFNNYSSSPVRRVFHRYLVLRARDVHARVRLLLRGGGGYGYGLDANRTETRRARCQRFVGFPLVVLDPHPIVSVNFDPLISLINKYIVGRQLQ